MTGRILIVVFGSKVTEIVAPPDQIIVASAPGFVGVQGEQSAVGSGE